MTEVSGRDIDNLYQGTTRTLDIDIIDENEQPVDLSTITAVEWRMAPNSYAVATLSKSLGSGITITDALAGKIAITILPGDTENMPCGRYYHECRLAEDTNTSKVFTGHITLSVS